MGVARRVRREEIRALERDPARRVLSGPVREVGPCRGKCLDLTVLHESDFVGMRDCHVRRAPASHEPERCVPAIRWKSDRHGRSDDDPASQVRQFDNAALFRDDELIAAALADQCTDLTTATLRLCNRGDRGGIQATC
jgi:hypothetical protein